MSKSLNFVVSIRLDKRSSNANGDYPIKLRVWNRASKKVKLYSCNKFTDPKSFEKALNQENLESQFMEFNKQINQELENAGYGKDFYKIYKVKKSDKANMHRYFQISSYTSDKHYEMTHDVSENYNKLLDAFWDSDLAKAFNKNRIYRKVYRIEN